MTVHLTTSRIGATVLAALRNHQLTLDSLHDSGFADAYPDLHEIATCGGTVEPLSSGEIDDLCIDLNTKGGVLLDYVPATEELREAARQEHGSDEIEIDEDAGTSPADEGTWVQAWVWLPAKVYTVELIADAVQVTATDADQAHRFATEDARSCVADWNYTVGEVALDDLGNEPNYDAGDAELEIEGTAEEPGKGERVFTHRATFTVTVRAMNAEEATAAAFELLGAKQPQPVEPVAEVQCPDCEGAGGHGERGTCNTCEGAGAVSPEDAESYLNMVAAVKAPALAHHWLPKG